ncbi:MAG: hypothetical protein GEU75_01460 [Dehalococcoidia bacterium]|nr:hypothetical protein [Dehalococcoidia bacterium]
MTIALPWNDVSSRGITTLLLAIAASIIVGSVTSVLNLAAHQILVVGLTGGLIGAAFTSRYFSSTPWEVAAFTIVSSGASFAGGFLAIELYSLNDLDSQYLAKRFWAVSAFPLLIALTGIALLQNRGALKLTFLPLLFLLTAGVGTVWGITNGNSLSGIAREEVKLLTLPLLVIVMNGAIRDERQFNSLATLVAITALPFAVLGLNVPPFRPGGLVVIALLVLALRTRTALILLLCLTPLILDDVLRQRAGFAALLIGVAVLGCYWLKDARGRKTLLVAVPVLMMVVGGIYYSGASEGTGLSKRITNLQAAQERRGELDQALQQRMYEIEEIRLEVSSKGLPWAILGAGSGAGIDLTGATVSAVRARVSDLADVGTIHIGPADVYHKWGLLGLTIYFSLGAYLGLWWFKRLTRKEQIEPGVIVLALYAVMIYADSIGTSNHMWSNGTAWIAIAAMLRSDSLRDLPKIKHVTQLESVQTRPAGGRL